MNSKIKEEFDKIHFIALSNGEQIAYRSLKAGTDSKKSIIMIHGLLSSSVVYDTLAEELCLNFNYNVIALDLRGFGYSSNKNEIMSLDELAEDVNLFCAALKIKRTNFIGLSLGGAVLMKLASNHPEITEKIILMGSVGKKKGEINRENIGFLLK